WLQSAANNPSFDFLKDPEEDIYTAEAGEAFHEYHIYVRRKIERGLNDVKEGRVLSEEEFEERFARWLGT
ncbi:MAG TPA: hypothetical protein VJO15_05720, partial [Dehalococcoidia bacterium]|nr:hypothetical protein [Dehalococcoidia bacterium]